MGCIDYIFVEPRLTPSSQLISASQILILANVFGCFTCAVDKSVLPISINRINIIRNFKLHLTFFRKVENCSHWLLVFLSLPTPPVCFLATNSSTYV